MSNNQASSSRSTRYWFVVPRSALRLMLFTAFLAVLVGLLCLAGKALVPAGKAASCVPFGIALLVYAAFVLLAASFMSPEKSDCESSSQEVKEDQEDSSKKKDQENSFRKED